MYKLVIIIGTRPEAIKLAPVILEAKKKKFDIAVLITNQHKELVKPILSGFGIKPDYEVSYSKSSLTQPRLIAKLSVEIAEIMQRTKPDLCIVQGDTSSAFIGALTAFHQRVLVAHIEAGLRTYQKYSPYPEEVYRKLITQLTDIFFVPTNKSRDNLLLENIPRGNIFLSGNTVIDALKHVISKKKGFTDENLKKIISIDRKLILVTSHRRESFGTPLRNILEAIITLADKYPLFDFVYPVHPNPNVREIVCKYLRNKPNVILIKPVQYFDFCFLMSKAYLILTDSGGIQEEAPSLHKPLLILRDVTERPEVVEAGGAILVGTERDKIIGAFDDLVNDKKTYAKMSNIVNPFGNGTSSKIIISKIKNFLNSCNKT